MFRGRVARMRTAADEDREARGRRELRCILMTAWDPVGMGDTAEAWDEYDGYLDGVGRRLRDAQGPRHAATAVADYLVHIERDLMDMASARSERHAGTLAESLVAWHEWSFDLGGRPPRAEGLSEGSAGPRE